MALGGSSPAPQTSYPEYIECAHCGAFTRNYLVACTYCHGMLVVSDAVASLDTSFNWSPNINMMSSGSDLVQEFTLQFERYPSTYNHIDWLTAVFLPSLVTQHDVHTQAQSRPERFRDWIDTGQEEDDWIQWPPAAHMVELVMDDDDDDDTVMDEHDPVLIGGGLLDSARQLFVSRVSMPQGVQCAVCLDEMHDGLQLVCVHAFHDACISPWFEQHDTCPTCRESLNTRVHALLRNS